MLNFDEAAHKYSDEIGHIPGVSEILESVGVGFDFNEVEIAKTVVGSKEQGQKMPVFAQINTFFKSDDGFVDFITRLQYERVGVQNTRKWFLVGHAGKIAHVLG